MNPCIYTNMSVYRTYVHVCVCAALNPEEELHLTLLGHWQQKQATRSPGPFWSGLALATVGLREHGRRRKPTTGSLFPYLGENPVLEAIT